jgi:hypothetical protein
MLPNQIEELNRRYRGQQVAVDPQQPDLTPWANLAGRIKAINCNGCALVQFDGPDQGWHDIDLACLRVVSPSIPPGDRPDPCP